MRFFYRFSVVLYGFFIRLASLFNAKAAQWVSGRRNLLKIIEKDMTEVQKPLIWLHCASLGEFEQGRPVLEKLKETHPEYGILLTFFSPSGYEVRKSYPLADYVYYLPLDTLKNARAFLNLVPVKLAIFVKYEFWYNYMHVLQTRNIPLVFVSAIFRPQQSFFRFYGSWFLKQLKKTTWFFVQNQQSLQLLKSVGISQASLSGDTRFDRVAEIARQAAPNEFLPQFKESQKLLLAGSSWPQDEALIYPLLDRFPKLKVVFAPHQIDEKHLEQIEQNCQNKSVRYSNAKPDILKEKQVLIIDNFGLLSSLYRYADFTLIGGGFGAGIHNTLEAATFGMPIFIGPNYQKFQEAKDLINIGAIEVITEALVLQTKLESLVNDKNLATKMGEAARSYVQKQTGASMHIVTHLEKQNLI